MSLFDPIASAGSTMSLIDPIASVGSLSYTYPHSKRQGNTLFTWIMSMDELKWKTAVRAKVPFCSSHPFPFQDHTWTLRISKYERYLGVMLVPCDGDFSQGVHMNYTLYYSEWMANAQNRMLDITKECQYTFTSVGLGKGTILYIPFDEGFPRRKRFAIGVYCQRGPSDPSTHFTQELKDEILERGVFENPQGSWEEGVLAVAFGKSLPPPTPTVLLNGLKEAFGDPALSDVCFRINETVVP